jgi:hypothetical protein
MGELVCAPSRVEIPRSGLMGTAIKMTQYVAVGLLTRVGRATAKASAVATTVTRDLAEQHPRLLTLVCRSCRIARSATPVTDPFKPLLLSVG